MNNGYTNTRMNLNEVCNWLTNKGYEELGDIIKDKFTYHTWTVNGMIRTDIVSDIFERVYGNNDMFMALECDVTTHMEFISYGEAHVD
jgi:hypothetical protein